VLGRHSGNGAARLERYRPTPLSFGEGLGGEVGLMTTAEQLAGIAATVKAGNDYKGKDKISI